MKRKPLSMKKLYQYAIDFLINKHKQDIRWSGIGQGKLESLIDESEAKQFIDYIWKNPK